MTNDFENGLSESQCQNLLITTKNALNPQRNFFPSDFSSSCGRIGRKDAVFKVVFSFHLARWFWLCHEAYFFHTTLTNSGEHLSDDSVWRSLVRLNEHLRVSLGVYHAL